MHQSFYCHADDISFYQQVGREAWRFESCLLEYQQRLPVSVHDHRPPADERSRRPQQHVDAPSPARTATTDHDAIPAFFPPSFPPITMIREKVFDAVFPLR